MKSCLLHSNMYQKLLFSTLTCEELGSHFCPYKIDLDKMKTSDFPGSVRDLRPQGTLPPRPEGQTRPLKSRRRGGNAGTGTQTRSQTDGAGAPGAPTLPGPSLQDPRRLPTMRTGERPLLPLGWREGSWDPHRIFRHLSWSSGEGRSSLSLQTASRSHPVSAHARTPTCTRAHSCQQRSTL